MHLILKFTHFIHIHIGTWPYNIYIYICGEGSITQTLSARWRHRFDRSPQTGEVLFTCDFSDVNTNLVLLIFPLGVIRSLSEQCRSSCTDNYPDIVERRHSAFSRFYANAKKPSDTSQLASTLVSAYVEQRTISLNKGLFSFIAPFARQMSLTTKTQFRWQCLHSILPQALPMQQDF